MNQTVRQGSRILLIAEDVATRLHLEARFMAGGHTVLLAQDSLDALVVAEQHAPDVIVLHASVPAQLGLDVLRPLRKGRLAAMVPALVVAADGSLILDYDSCSPRLVSDAPIALEDILSHVERLTLAS